MEVTDELERVFLDVELYCTIKVQVQKLSGIMNRVLISVVVVFGFQLARVKLDRILVFEEVVQFCLLELGEGNLLVSS